MEYFDAIVLSIVEGVTEFLPVSSTGHMILAQYFLGIENTDSVKAFLVIVQAGAILAVLTVFWPTFLRWSRSWLSWVLPGLVNQSATDIRDRLQSLSFCVSVLPFAILGYFNRDFIKSLFDPKVVAYALLVGGVLILLDEWVFSRRRSSQERSIEEFGFRDALIVGLGQCLALWPGFSRSAATIVVGRWRGFSRTSAAEVSFLVGLPTLCGAALFEMKSSWDLIDAHTRHQLFVGILISWIVAYVCVKSFLIFLKRFPLTVFAYYRIIVAVVLLFLLA